MRYPIKSANNKPYIAPIAIDLGATHTGVFRALYPQGTAIDRIENRHGEVLILERNNYTLLMTERTARRHMRRGFKRRKLAKRLLRVILKAYFDFPADEHRQALGFLMNRRGFTRLEEACDMQALAEFPEQAWAALPEDAQKYLGSREHLDLTLNRLTADEPDQIKQLDDVFMQDCIQPVKNDLFVLGYVEKLQKALELRQQGKTIEETKKGKKLSQTPSWVVERLIKSGIDTLPRPADEEENVDLLAVVNQTENPDQLLDQLDQVNKTLSTEKSTVWAKVNPANFDLEKNTEKLTDPKTQIEAHLNNLVFAVHKAREELASGSRHRRKYFEEIEADIKNAGANPHKYMQRLAQAIKDSNNLDEERLLRLIAHIGNLELKPLRACFNDRAHREKDQWQPEKLARIVSRWFLKQWRVSEARDGKQKVEQYKELKSQWQQHGDKNNMVAFWLGTDPELTIPPYQSQANRCPPGCQSLILNGKYMNTHYPDWKNWLNAFDTTATPDLAAITRRGSVEPLANAEQRRLRQLQFVLDRVQNADPCRLNRIWSHYHGHRKGGDKAADYEQKLQQEIAASVLPDTLKKALKDPDQWRQEGSFGHFINHYYNARRKARDGRYFIHPSPRGKGKFEPTKQRPRWDDENKLLTLCPHRPRQKQHQMHLDFAAIVGLTPAQLEQCLDGKDVETLLRSIKDFATNAENAARAQKAHRGELRLILQRGKDKKLNNLANRIEKLALKLAEKLWPGSSEEERKAKARRFHSLFSFAQIHNIVFKDRGGFSSTCPVCSADNAGRMVRDADDNALAARLPALPVRPIDGAVQKLLDRKAGEIARRQWALIEPELDKGHEVRVPLILEQNRFEFEPALAKLKGKPGKKESPPQGESFDEKTARIKNASKGLCPYTGSPLAEGGELDHIIPRASNYGTLNDEANLIYVSQAANRSRSNQNYYLKDLNSNYKQAVFGSTDDTKIRETIYRTLLGKAPGEDDAAPFLFGNYLSFINLTEEQQIAFRHTLFLGDDDPLKERVIAALQNRNRTYVNGTQRFLGQLIANKLNDRARRQNLAGRLRFDYFEYPADPRHPKGVQNLRGALGIDKEKIQDDYSHHVDAHMAFLLACDDHRGDGSLGVDFGNIASVWPFDDRDIRAYQETRIDSAKVESVELRRKSTNAKIDQLILTQKSKPLSRNNFRQLFKQQAIGQTYKPIFYSEGKWYIGYPRAIQHGYDLRTYAEELEGKRAKMAKAIVEDGLFYEQVPSGSDIQIYTCRKENKRKIIDIEVEKFLGRTARKTENEKEKTRLDQLDFILKNCRIYMTKTPLLQAPGVLASEEAQKHPSIERWKQFDAGWKKIASDKYKETKQGNKLTYDLHSDELRSKWHEYCQKFLNIGQSNHPVRHRKKRTVYSMNTVGTSSGTVLLINRHGQGIYQSVPIDNNELAKKLAPYLIHNSKHIAWPHADDSRYLGKPLEPVNEKDIKQELQPEQFFTKELLDKIQSTGRINIHIENTKVSIENFPVQLIKKIISSDDIEKSTSYSILTDKKIKSSREKHAIKSIIDNWFRPTCRDGTLKILALDSDLCSVEIPYKRNELEKYLKKLESP